MLRKAASSSLKVEDKHERIADRGVRKPILQNKK